MNILLQCERHGWLHHQPFQPRQRLLHDLIGFLNDRLRKRDLDWIPRQWLHLRHILIIHIDAGVARTVKQPLKQVRHLLVMHIPLPHQAGGDQSPGAIRIQRDIG